jgi:tetratricopeptide (TPR) repeat protein
MGGSRESDVAKAVQSHTSDFGSEMQDSSDFKMPSRLLARLAGFCLILVAVCYANSIFNDFIADDLYVVALNPAIRTIAPLDYLFAPFWGENSELGIYRPLVIFSYSLEYSIWQRWAPGFHVTNMLLHAINGILVFMLARTFVASRAAAWAATAIYLAHPVHTESVAAIAGRSELLAGTFFFLAWLFFRKERPVLCAVAFLLSLLSKENAIAFPLVLVLDTWLSQGSFRSVLARWQRFVLPAVSVGVYLGLRFFVLGSVGMPQSAQYLSGKWTFVERELTSGRSFVAYFELLLAPIDLAGNYDFNSIPLASARDWDAWAGLLLVAATMVLAFRFRRQEPAIAFGVLFFYTAMLPMSNWIIPAGVLVAERYLYVPLFGFAIIAGTLWSKIPRVEVRKILAVGMLAVMAVLCISHNYVWKDDFTYYGNMVRVFPDNTRGRQGYGVALLRANRVAEARAQFEAGMQIARTTPLLVSLAGTLIQIEQSCRNAYPLLDEALGVQPKDYFARWLVAECYESEGKVEMAERIYRKAVEDAAFPDPRLLLDWAHSLESLDRTAEALDVYRRAALVDPNDFAIQQKVTALSSIPARD